MNYRQIISEAWVFTQENKRMIVWYAFIPSILTTAVGVGYLLYQFYSFKSSVFFENWQESFVAVVIENTYRMALDHLGSLFPVIIMAVLLALLYFFLPPIAEGGIVQLIARKRNGQEVRLRDGVRYGLFSFLRLFNYSWIARSFNLISIGGEIGLIARNLGKVFGTESLQIFYPIFILMVIIGVIMSVLFLFTEYFIVIDDRDVKEAMAKSAVLVFKHLDAALMLSLLLLVIAIRILLQIVFVFLVPIAVLAAVFFVVSSIPFFALVLGVIFGFLALLFASYLGAIVHVFTASVWVFTFLDLTNAPEVNAREQAN